MKALISNDDGINSLGLLTLTNILKQFAEVVVVAPDYQRSGASHSITLDRPLKVGQVNLCQGVQAYQVNGSPVDCVKLGIEHLCSSQPDLVVSGINAGANLGQDLFYSGTLAIAREAQLYQIPAFALSMARDQDNLVHFSRIESSLQKLIQYLLANFKTFEGFLNINFPSMENQPIQGLKVVPMDLSIKKFDFKVMQDPKNRQVFWLRNRYQDIEPNQVKSDYHYIKSGYITASPLNLSQQSSTLMEQVANNINEKEIY